MLLRDAVRAFRLAAESDHKPGVRIMNAAGPRAWVKEPVADVLSAWWGQDVDLSHFRSDRRYDSVYRVERIESELGFVAHYQPQL